MKDQKVSEGVSFFATDETPIEILMSGRTELKAMLDTLCQETDYYVSNVVIVGERTFTCILKFARSPHKFNVTGIVEETKMICVFPGNDVVEVLFTNEDAECRFFETVFEFMKDHKHVATQWLCKRDIIRNIWIDESQRTSRFDYKRALEALGEDIENILSTRFVNLVYELSTEEVLDAICEYDHTDEVEILETYLISEKNEITAETVEHLVQIALEYDIEIPGDIAMYCDPDEGTYRVK